MMKNKEKMNRILTLTSLTCFFGSSVAVAQTSVSVPVDLPTQPDQRVETALPEQIPTVPQSEMEKTPRKSEPQTRHLTSEQLLQEPALLQRALDSAMFSRDMEAVRLLLPIYQKLDSHQQDTILLQYAQARLAQADGQFEQAISFYENILQKQQNAAPVRMDLIQALLYDARYVEAREHIALLKQKEDLPQEINNLLKQYNDFLEGQEKWKLSGNLNYLQENNLNNAPKQSTLETETGTWHFPEAEKARGVNYDFSADKKWLLSKNRAIIAGANVYGKQYAGKRDYNDLNIGFHTGFSHRNAKREWRVSPFYEKRWFGGKSYSQQFGARVQHNRALNRHWHSFSNVRYAYTKHQHRPFLDGNSISFSQTFQYQAKPNQVALFGVDLLRENARDKSSASIRKAVRVGLIHQWNHWEHAIHLSAATRRYDRPDWFLNQRRKDRELSVYTTLAHKKIQWRGLMPKLAVRWNQNRSNHLLYRYQKQQVFLEVGKTF